MQITFAPSRQSSVGIEWELGLVDLTSGELAPAGPQIVAACQGGSQAPIRGEYLQTMVELTSGVHLRVADAVDDLAGHLAEVRAAAAELGIGLLGSGTHPFSIAAAQPLTPGPRYQRVAERNAYWGSQMAICGTHVHIGVDNKNKALPITASLARFYPYLLAISCSSPYWEGQDCGYASQRTMLFQQLATNGLPYPMQDWAAFEDYAEDLLRSGMISLPDEIRWDVRPSPKFGTVENRVADSVPTAGRTGCDRCAHSVLRRVHLAQLHRRPHARGPAAVAGQGEQVARRPLRAGRRGDHPAAAEPGATAGRPGPVAGATPAGRHGPGMHRGTALRVAAG